MKLVAVAAVLASGGCDRVFQLGEVKDLGGSGSDSAISGCWSSAPESFDEDGDGEPDGCDFCPADAALSSDQDADGDRVSDVCDPDLTAGSTVIDFDGFATQRLWEPQSGVWMFTAGAYAVLDASPSRSELTVPVAEEPRVDMIFNSLASVGVYMKVGAASVEVSCIHEKRSGSPDSLVLRVGGKTLEMSLDDGNTNGRLRVGIDTDGHAYCLGKRGSLSAMVIDTGSSDRSTTRVGLLSSDASFASVTVFGKSSDR